MIQNAAKGFLSALLCLSLLGLGWMFILRPQVTTRETQNLKAEYSQSIPGAASSGDAPIQPDATLDLAALQTQYPDLQGWLTIPGTPVDYPVMQSGADQPEYYLRRNFNGDWQTAGSLFFQYDCEITDCRNLVIYGHNLGDSTMFGCLDKMQNPVYRQEHSTVLLQTESGVTVYRVESVLTVDAAQFSFNRTRFADDADFISFAASLLYGSQHTPQADDRLLTLATCSDSHASGSVRLIVVAVAQARSS